MLDCPVAFTLPRHFIEIMFMNLPVCFSKIGLMHQKKAPERVDMFHRASGRKSDSSPCAQTCVSDAGYITQSGPFAEITPKMHHLHVFEPGVLASFFNFFLPLTVKRVNAPASGIARAVLFCMFCIKPGPD